MSEQNTVLPEIEPDRHELRAASPYHFKFTRRDFIESVGAGVVVLVSLRAAPLLAELPDQQQQQIPDAIGAWLHIAEDGAVTVYTGKVEVGQDIRTSLTQAIAEELRVAPAQIKLVMGDTDLTPYDAGTFGSRSTPQMGTQLRRAAAAARDLLLQRAAEQWETTPSALELRDGRVADKSGRRSEAIGGITRGGKLVQSIGAANPVAPVNWRISGTTVPKVSGRDMVTGKHRFTADMRMPDMLIGKVLRPPAAGATLVSADVSAARAIAGVTVVSDNDFVGVAAPDERTATRALSLIKAQWQQTEQPSHRTIFEHLKRTANAAPASAPIQADEVLEATYTTAYIAHVPLEPRAALAQWDAGKLTVWTGTQRPFGVRDELVRAFRVAPERVRVIVPDTGAAYGGKHSGEAAIEAARLAQAAQKPVKLVWTREEEFAWAYFRPAALIEVRAGVSRDGTLTHWDFTNYNAGNSGIGMPYQLQGAQTRYLPSQTPLRQGSYRALAATANNFARETHMNELATRVGMDPVAFRLKNLSNPRMRAVLEAAAQKSGWSNWKPAPGRGLGIACGTEKGGFVTTTAEVTVDRATGRVTPTRVVVAFECGAIVNPDGLENQVEGAIVQGLGGALWEAIEFENGRILNPRLSQYRVPRHSDMPVIECVLVNRKDLPSAGAGETPIIALAPALGAAIYQASGVRLRALPLVPQGLATG